MKRKFKKYKSDNKTKRLSKKPKVINPKLSMDLRKIIPSLV